MRVAIITGGADSLDQVKAYMPANYTVQSHYVLPINRGGTGRKQMERGDVLVIVGEDEAGWTLDGYVIPRLASGLIFAEEITLF